MGTGWGARIAEIDRLGDCDRGTWLGCGATAFTALGDGVRLRGALSCFSDERAFAADLEGVALRGALVVDKTFDRRTFVESGVTLATFKG